MFLSDIVIYLGGGAFSSDVGIVNLHPTEGTHWVVYSNQNYFDSFGFSPPQKLSRLIKTQNGLCLHSD